MVSVCGLRIGFSVFYSLNGMGSKAALQGNNIVSAEGGQDGYCYGGTQG